MKDEELVKKAEEYIDQFGFGSDFNNIASYEANEAIAQGFFVGFREGKRTHWHDLRKNPDDLPNNNTNVIVKTSSITECAVFHKRLDGTYFWNCSFSPIESHPKSVIAWCEIPKYTEE